MKLAHFRFFGMTCVGFLFFLNGSKVDFDSDPFYLHSLALLGVNLVFTIGYFYLLAKERAYFIDESGRKPIRLFGSPKLMGGFLIASILYLSVLIFLHHLKGFSYFPFLLGYMLVLLFVMIFNSAFDDKMLIGQQQY
jgi:hypothetical protein